MNRKISVLIIEDDPVISEFIQTGLRYENYEVTTSNSGNGGLDLLYQNSFSLLVLDIVLPDIDGFEVCRRIRNDGFDLPVLMLTVKKNISDRVRGLDSGADDYLTKPFSFDELLARIRALLRRSGKIKKDRIITAGVLVLNAETREVSFKDRRLNLTPTEFALLEIFMSYPHRVFTRETLLNRVLGYDYDGGTNIIDVHVNHLRLKLDDKLHQIIRTRYGVGYAFYPEVR